MVAAGCVNVGVIHVKKLLALWDNDMVMVTIEKMHIEKG
jgi:hypothetical protein